MRWVVGDVQGCARELETLLKRIRFDPARDELWSAGDLINKGPDSLEVMRLWTAAGGRGVLGNHEVDALTLYTGTRKKKRHTLDALFDADDAAALMDALRRLPVIVFLASAGRGPDAWLVHAGLKPRWTDLKRLASRLNAGSHDDDWLLGDDVTFATNVRCCTPAGDLSDHTGPPEECAEPFRPWDALWGGHDFVVHGHWAARGYYREERTLGLDSGCVYGRALTAWCQDEDRIVTIPAASR
jgi:bis(5'-nucleosyl)-tetraphosphatase (symmetrical)